MTEFLKQVARHYYPSDDLRGICFIFPNKRSALFFKKYLGEEVAKEKRTVMAPRCYTMNDFFYKVSGARKTDRIRQLLILYDCYRNVHRNPEPIDDFLYWGTVILSDFEDVDKYLADPAKLWKNVEEFKGMQDLSFLNEDQQKAIRGFLGHFSNDGPVKQDFLQIWNILLPLYRSFNTALEKQGFSYEGMVYRKIGRELEEKSAAELLEGAFEAGTKFVFVGLNAMNECESRLLDKMHKAGIAEFCWDFSSKEIKDAENKSSFFLSSNLRRFGQAFVPDPEGLQKPEINVLSVPSAIGQAKQLPAILEKTGGPHDLHTAIVLPDEGLLVPVLNSIPSEITEINVTMGYPMKGSEWLGLLNLIGALQCNARETPEGTAFYHKQLWAIFSNGVFRSAITDEERLRTENIKTAAKYYVPASEFSGGGLLEAIFHKAEDKAEYLKRIILSIARAIHGEPSKAMELDFAMHSYKAVTHLQGLKPDVLDKTWWKLLWQLLSTDVVPFLGEPLRGMQIMGPLETRSLDFDNLIILSCNEGMFPRRSAPSSFIPPELRKGFGLPTHEFQDSVWAYYFYRSIQRAKKVWLLLDSRTEVSRSGEESRYIKQLELLYGFKLKRHVVKSPVKGLEIPDSIPKTEADLKLLSSPGFHLSASAMRQYLNCQASFYYSSIAGLKKPEEVEESLDAGMLGSVLHTTMHALYSSNPDEAEEKKLKPLPQISAGYLKSLLADKDLLHSRVRQRIRQKLNNAPEVTGRNLVFEEIICRYVQEILSRDLELLREKGLPAFKILGLEEFRKTQIGGFNFVGFLDRIDSFEPGTMRIVDYKTGHVTDDEMDISDSNTQKLLGALFGTDNKNRPGIALQLYIYDRLMEGHTGGTLLLNSIYHTGRLFVEGVRTSRLSKAFCDALEPMLLEKLHELKDPALPWKRTPDAESCKYCDFKNICGR